MNICVNVIDSAQPFSYQSINIAFFEDRYAIRLTR